MNRKAFTLIEVLVVIAIIGILSSIVIVNLNWAIDSANDTKRKVDIDTVRKAIVYYKTQNSTGEYPIQEDECNIGPVGTTNRCTVLASALAPILPNLPVDTVSGGYYTYVSDGTDFTVNSTLSNSTTYSYTASTGFSTEASSYESTCAAASNADVTCIEGIISSTEAYCKCVLTGTTTGTTSWTVPSGVTSVRYLVVGGGGGGGYYLGGGGGGGGFLTGNISVSGSASIIVGAGGTSDNNGESSTFSSITASGGGAGGANSDDGSIGGSGGGGGSDGDTQRYAGDAISGQGYAGGDGEVTWGGSEQAGGGGGGAGGVGSAGEYESGGDGGIGLQSNITGSSVYYAGGGGGMVGFNAIHIAVGGNGGGANGTITYNNGLNGTDGFGGGGGGGAGPEYIGGTGGSGVVIFRYTHP